MHLGCVKWARLAGVFFFGQICSTSFCCGNPQAKKYVSSNAEISCVFYQMLDFY